MYDCRDLVTEDLHPSTLSDTIAAVSHVLLVVYTWVIGLHYVSIKLRI